MRANDCYQRWRYGLYGSYGSGGGVVEVSNKIHGFEEIAGNRAVKSILPWPTAEQGVTETVHRDFVGPNTLGLPKPGCQ